MTRLDYFAFVKVVILFLFTVIFYVFIRGSKENLEFQVFSVLKDLRYYQL